MATKEKNTQKNKIKTQDIFIITDFPKITLLEVKELIKKEGKIFGDVCLIKDLKNEEIVKLCYHLQSAKKVCINLLNFEINDDKKEQKEIIELINKKFGKIDSSYLKNIQTFEARTEHNSNICISTNELNKCLGEIILKNNETLYVNLKQPEISIFCYIDTYFFIGIDLIGFDLTKRPYKIWSKADSLNGAFAYSLIRLANIKKTSSIVDPFAGTGIIPIEASLFQTNTSAFRFENKFFGFNLDFIKKDFYDGEEQERKKSTADKISIYAYDMLMKNVMGIQKNSKLAGVEKQLTISKIAIDWIDSKFEEKSVDFIITDPPKVNKRLENEKDIEKLYDELFYQAKYILKKTGKIFILTNDDEIPKKQSLKYKFKIIFDEKINRGEQIYCYLGFEIEK
jgi:23S rRNA G2445 N2-methylase RlmL